jgi:stress-induced morphogen
MAMHPDTIKTLIQEAFSDAEIVIKDLRGDGDHYAVTVTSKAFQGKTRVQQHQLVYQALQGHMGTTLHAMALTTVVPSL